jgi:hypothetical protein
MSQDSTLSVRRWPICIASGILAASLFLVVWIPFHPSRPHLPTSDLYTHLSVARHLARGDGFLTDVTYPLSFAFPFARELPQPLIHRQPGFAVLLTVPHHAGGGEPSRVLENVRWLQIILLGVVLGAGAAGFWRRKNLGGVVPWLILIYFNPLLVFAVDWGMVELASSLLLLVLWLRARGDSPGRPNWIDGLLGGALSMLRLDLFWVPIMWWILLRRIPRQESPGPVLTKRRLGLVVLAWFLVIAPWAIRNIQVTGQPAFTLQAFAEHVKDTRTWPGYTVYQQLEPQPFFQTMTSDPVPVLRKVGRGMKFYYRELPRLVPPLVLVGFACGALAFLAVFLKIAPGNPMRRRWDSPLHLPTISRSGPVALVVMTIVLLTIQYSFFDHSLRHLLVVLPVMLWEFSSWIGDSIRRNIHGRHEDRGGRSRLQRNLGSYFILPAAVALVVVFLLPCRLPGWESAATEAVGLVAKTELQIESAGQAPDGVLFVDNSAVPWFLDRPAVWAPAKEADRARICEFLGQPEAKP